MAERLRKSRVRDFINDIQEWRIKRVFLLEIAKLLREDSEKAREYADYYEKYIQPLPQPFDIDLA